MATRLASKGDESVRSQPGARRRVSIPPNSMPGPAASAPVPSELGARGPAAGRPANALASSVRRPAVSARGPRPPAPTVPPQRRTARPALAAPLRQPLQNPPPPPPGQSLVAAPLLAPLCFLPRRHPHSACLLASVRVAPRSGLAQLPPQQT